MPLRLQTNVALAPLTTFGIGGRTRRFVSVSTSAELVEAISLARKKRWPYRLMAGGSNVVFDDKIFPGLVIRYLSSPGHQGQTLKPLKGLTLICEAGIPLAFLIKTAIKHNLAGLETLSGIPGTVGGAIVGNAGAYGQTISDRLIRVEIFDGRETNWLTRKECRFAYRDSLFKKKRWLVLRAEFKLKTGDKKRLAKTSREIIELRSGKYNSKLRSPGSFFKNVLVRDLSKKSLALIDPEKIRAGKIPAGYLLEQVGAKGLRLGGLAVADYHGNLLINTGRATYREVRRLANLLKRRVQKKFGVTLEEEVRYMV